jgi:Fe-S cluster assembly protein SufD
MAHGMTHAQAPGAHHAERGTAARPWLDEAAIRERSAAVLGTGLIREAWKYTPIGGFLEAMEAAPGDTLPRLSGADQAGVVATPLASLGSDQLARVRQVIAGDLNHERHPLADLTLLRAAAGWLIEVSEPLSGPIEIHHPAVGLAPVFLLLGAQADATVIEHLQGGAFQSQLLHADVGPGARLQHHRAALHNNIGHYSLLSVRLARDAAYRLNQTLLGGKRRRAEIHVVVAERGADVDLTGAYLVEDGQHLDQHLVVEHRAGHGNSRQKFHGIGAGKGKSVFNGRIHIHPNAPQTDASLSNRNLALHPDAEMDTKPELEIYTDDVRCAHGATVGQLAPDSLFYLTARGIPEATARRLLSHGFVRECLAGPLTEASAARLMEALP